MTLPMPEWEIKQKKFVAREAWYEGTKPQVIARVVALPLETIQDWIEKEFKPKKDVDQLIEQILKA